MTLRQLEATADKARKSRAVTMVDIDPIRRERSLHLLMGKKRVIDESLCVMLWQLEMACQQASAICFSS